MVMFPLYFTTAIIGYLPGFFLLAFLPRWRWLLPVSGAALLFCAWGFVAVQVLESYDGLFATVALVFLICGLISGFLFRAGVLTWRRLQHAGPQAAFGFATFVLTPALFCGTVYGMYLVREHLRTPTLACASGLHPAKLDDMRLALPTAPNLVIQTKQTSQPAYFWFNVPEDITRFCGMAAASAPALISVKLQTDRVSLDRSAWFCAERRNYDWWPIACVRNHDRTEPRFSGEIEFFLIDQSRNRSYERLRDELKRIQAGAHPLDQAADGFRRYRKDDRWLSYVRGDDSNYIAECEAGDGKIVNAYMTCTVARELAPNIGLTYRLVASDSIFPARARTLDAKAMAFVASLQAQGEVTPLSPAR